jgi:hypothetical protein
MNPSALNQAKKIPEKFLSGERMYGTEERGMVLILPGELPPARFGDNPGLHHLCILDMEETRKNIPPEIQRQMAMAIEESKPFKQGRVFYVKSPAEIDAENKKKAQVESLAKYKNTLAQGLFELKLEDRTIEQLVSFSDEIGSASLDKNGNPLPKFVLIKNIERLLGIVETETATETAIVEPEEKVTKRRGRKPKNAESIKRVEESPHQDA